MNRFWLLEWTDEMGIRTEDDAERVVSEEGNPFQRLRELAQEADADEPEERLPDSEFTIVAGVGLDMTADLGCTHHECRKEQIDKLFRRAWQYFDEIIVADELRHAVAYHWDEVSPEWKEHVFLHTIKTLVYLKEIGAEGLLRFREKRPGAAKFWQGQLGKGAIQALRKSSTPLVQELADRAAIIYDNESGMWWVKHQRLLDHATAVSVPPGTLKNRTEDQRRRLIARDVVYGALGYLLADTDAARRAAAPLAVNNPIHREILLRKRGDSASPEAVAFDLQLPFLEDIPIPDLLRIREDEAELFSRFRSGLRVAIKERLKLDLAADSRRVARDIQEDLIEPELHAIRAKLTSARSALIKKMAINLGVGALATTCGVLAGMGPGALVGLALPGVLGAGPAHDYFDEAKQVEQRDLFFVWKATQHSH